MKDYYIAGAWVRVAQKQAVLVKVVKVAAPRWEPSIWHGSVVGSGLHAEWFGQGTVAVLDNLS